MRSNDTEPVLIDVGLLIVTGPMPLNYVANESFAFFMDYIDHRELDIEKLMNMREEIEEVIWMYLATHHLQKVIVEVYRNDTGKLVERFDLSYEINPEDLTASEIHEMQEGKFDSFHEDIVDALSQYESLPEGCTYRVLFGLREKNEAGKDPPDIEYLGQTTTKSTGRLRKENRGDYVNLNDFEYFELYI